MSIHPCGSAWGLWCLLAFTAAVVVTAQTGRSVSPSRYLPVNSQCGGIANCPSPTRGCKDAPWGDIACEQGTACLRVSPFIYTCADILPATAKKPSSVSTPLNPGTAPPRKPAATAPVQPVTAVAPVRPAAVGPVKPTGAAPVVKPGATSAPVKLGVIAPAKQVTTAPSKHGRAAPAKPQVTTSAAEEEEPVKLESIATLPTKPKTAATAGPPKRPAPTAPKTPLYIAPKHVLGPDGKPLKNYKEVIAIDPNTKVVVSPNRPSADRPAGAWIPGRATFYGSSKAIENAYAAAKQGEPGMWGVIEDGSCGFTQLDGANGKSLPYPREIFAAAADTNLDYPGSCGRCYQIKCRTGPLENDGKKLRLTDLEYGVEVPFLDSKGRKWPGNPLKKDGWSYSYCWNESATITIKVGDTCPCIYKLNDGTVRRQWSCCGGHNHFDLSYWAFEKLVHPSYGVMNTLYRPVDCLTNEPLDANPGYVDQNIYMDDLGSGWAWRTYGAKNTKLMAKGEGISGNATCATLSKDGAIPFVCRECTKPGYQPFANAEMLQFWVRSNTKSLDPFASSTPPGKLPGLKIFLMNDEKNLYCKSEVVLGKTHQPTDRFATWFRFDIPLADWACPLGSAGSLANIDRVDFQNINVRDANICLDEISLL